MFRICRRLSALFSDHRRYIYFFLKATLPYFFIRSALFSFAAGKHSAARPARPKSPIRPGSA
jgi:hypothetical protein